MKKFLTISLMCCFSSLAFAGWQPVASPVTAHLRSVCQVAPTSVFAAGSDGTIIQYDGIEWTEMESGSDKNLNTIAMINANEGWAAGVEGILLRCTAGVWAVFPTGTESRTFNSILGFATDDVYFLSYSLVEGSTLHHWDGADLSDMQTFSDNMTCLAGDGPDNLWVSGGTNAIFHWNGTTWDSSMSALPETTKIFSIVLNEYGNPVVTGVRLPSWDVDMILEYTPGSGWSQVFSGYEKRIITCAINDKRGFAMGASGRVIEDTIFGWQEITGPVNVQINDVILPNMAEGWAVTDQGGILRYEQPSINLIMNSNEINSADTFEVQLELLNPGTAINNVMEIAFLDVYGFLWFWPSWSSDFDYQMINMPADYHESMVLFSFEWPNGAGTGGAALWAALLDSQNNILGYDIEDFMWID
ncbi:hypothetical protein JW823_02475 [bacterium]|nr:hypothetical protein [candidate division CSSED10-310 bacterium]